MKKAVTLTLIAILLLGLFAGCNTYTRPAVNSADGARVTRGFQYHHDGGTTRSTRVHDGVRENLRDGRTSHNFRHDGHVRGFDSTSNNEGFAGHSSGTDYGTMHGTGFRHGAGAVRPNTVRPTVDGVNGTTTAQ